MASAKLIETHRNGAEIYHGDACRDKILKVLEEFCIPKNLLPLEGVNEFGFNRSAGFIWFKLKKKMDKRFPKIGQRIGYSEEDTAFIEKGHLSKVTGCKAKEVLVPLTIHDVLVGAPSPDMIKFTTNIGVARSYPLSASELEDGGNKASKI